MFKIPITLVEKFGIKGLTIAKAITCLKINMNKTKKAIFAGMTGSAVYINV